MHLSYDSCNEYPQRFTLRLFGLPESAMEAGQPLTCRLERAARRTFHSSCGPAPARQSGLAIRITYLGLPPTSTTPYPHADERTAHPLPHDHNGGGGAAGLAASPTRPEGPRAPRP